MKKTGVVTDSHSSIKPAEAAKLGVLLLPMPFYLDDKCYYEDVTITRDEFFEKVRGGAKSALPSQHRMQCVSFGIRRLSSLRKSYIFR